VHGNGETPPAAGSAGSVSLLCPLERGLPQWLDEASTLGSCPDVLLQPRSTGRDTHASDVGVARRDVARLLFRGVR
jgi:hypothetical protein